MKNLTSSQQRAVAARGNVMVMAGAGTGKTHTLVARCLNLICEENVSLDEILIVTFTEAAATEMRQRLRDALEKKSPENSNSFLAEQLALFDAAHIGTLHSFCLKLVREHFYELGLDPQISILDEGQTRLLADETLEEQFNAHYENEDEFSLAVQELIKIYGNGRDETIRAFVLQLHHYSQTRPDAEGWLARQIEIFSASEPTQWREWFSEAISNWQNEWLPALENLIAENPKAAECLEILGKTPGSAPVSGAVRRVLAPNTNAAEILEQIVAADGKENFPKGKFIKLREPLEDFFDDAKFLNSLAPTKENDPLAEDWNWTRGHMKALLQLAREFSEKFSARKRADGVLDFHDLEQFALKLLWNFETKKPAEIAGRWREKLRFIFVDEYQDINAAQDKIIAALSREGKNSNRFLVGDVKQSIYRFRLADPKIFRDYARDWRGKNGETIPLTENFRSRESLLNFVNSLFEPLMREEIGGVNYDEEAKLKFGRRWGETPGEPDQLSETAREDARPTENGPRVELLLRLKNSGNENSDFENDDEIADLDESEKEARMLALRLLGLKNSRHEIWDDKAKIFRAVDWRDMAILLRAPSGKAEIFAKQFDRAGIPLVVERGGFYASGEILDLLSLLQLLDNPLQDVPCIAVLRSPLVGCSLDELAEIRLLGSGKFWFALNQAQTPKSRIPNETRAKVEKFLERFHRWRKLAQQFSLSQCLETILAETHYDDWLKSRPRGAQRHANVQRLLNLAEKFDQFQRQGLFRFLKFVEAQREIEAEPELAPVAEENAVRLMSIHQSKGLEFPVVALADLAKNFNEQDLRGEIILDEKFGLCLRVKPPSSGGRYPSLSYWLAQKNQRRELRGEELRLLYVALTRARNDLILSASVSEKKWETVWKKPGAITPQKILSAKSFADWLGLWFGNQVQSPKPKAQGEMEGEAPHLRWRIADDAELAGKPEIRNLKSEIELPVFDANSVKILRAVLDWNYKFESATERAAKTSVTALQRQVDELDEEAEQKFSAKRRAKTLAPTTQNPKSEIGNRKLSAADAGAATHKFLQRFKFEIAADLKSLETEARRLEAENYLSADEAAILNLKSVAAFWNSDFGKKILANAANVKRELPFTAKFAPQELDEILGTKSGANLENEFVIVQGVADLVVLLPEEIWLVDFKTDEVRANELTDKIKMYSPQLEFYARALEKIYSRPVTICRLHFLAAGKTVDVRI
jgi:ATP-dependent helicase/nuclease subunit A